MTAVTFRQADASYVELQQFTHRLSRDDQRLLRGARSIKGRYADGEPLRGKDRRLVLALLKRHPRAAEKIGPGVEAIVVDQFVGGARCFFVIRTDGRAEDFSIYKCLGRRDARTARVLALMRKFNYRAVLRHFRRYQDAVDAGQAIAASR